jgi:hypothetical protein
MTFYTENADEKRPAVGCYFGIFVVGFPLSSPALIGMHINTGAEPACSVSAAAR